MKDIKTYAKDSGILTMMQKAIDHFAKEYMYECEFRSWCAMHNLQGHKRMHRHFSCEGNAMRVCLQDFCISTYGEEIKPLWNYSSFVVATDIAGYYDRYLDWVCYSVQTLNQLIGELENANYHCEAEMLMCHLKCLVKRVQKIRRMTDDYAKAESPWHHVTRRDNMLHKKYKKKEKK